jgi:hypothetical protein
VVLERMLARRVVRHPLVQALHPQQSADALVERELVSDHGPTSVTEEKLPVLPKSQQK